MSNYFFEYSRTSRAKCSAEPPCEESSIHVGSLRYGKLFLTEYGKTIAWRHWKCVTPTILTELSGVDLNTTNSFETLSRKDQTKIRQAIKVRRVDLESDVPPMAAVTSAGAPSERKRKAAFEEQNAGTSKGLTSSSQRNAVIPTASQYVKDEEANSTPQEDEPIDELYCTLNTAIVGVQYYTGMVGYGEQVKLIREPTNAYDRNAIQVKNISNIQVGHVPKGVAAKLAPLLDQRRVTVEGVMQEGNLSSHKYSLGMDIKIYGPMVLRTQLEPALIWATPGQRGFQQQTSKTRKQAINTAVMPFSSQSTVVSSYSEYQAPQSFSQSRGGLGRAPAQTTAQKKMQEDMQRALELKQILNNLEKVDDEGRRNSLLDQLLSTDDVLNLPEHPNPPGIASRELQVNLLKHQRQALKWCIERENPVLPRSEPDKPVQFWQLRKNGATTYYYNLATKTPQAAPPDLGRGALCADSMGLGKTLTIIALILATKKDVSRNFSNSTLIVVPLSILSNWKKQIDDHCVEGALSYYIYYGTGCSINATELQKYDVIITTFLTVSGEDPNASKHDQPSKKRKKGDRSLFDVKWKRVVLDEGHQIRNAKTKTAQAVCALQAERRWILTGTPIINSPKDLGSLLTFLKICRPLDQEEFFKSLVLRPLAGSDPSGAELLRGIMSHICIRRTKEMQDAKGNYLISLPPVDMTLVPVALSPKARELYDAVEDVSRRKVEGLLRSGFGGGSVQMGALSLLTRLRQLALHPGLIPANYVQQLELAEDMDAQPHGAINVTPEGKIRLQELLTQAIEDCEECPICFNILENPRITNCTHRFCLACIIEVINRDPRCPMDRRPIGMADLFEPPPPTELTQAPVPRDDDDNEDGEANDLRTGTSDKIDQLIHLLKLTPSTDKSLVFSQFTSFLDKIGEALEAEGMSFVRFDGKMSARRREETIRRFSVPIVDGDVESFPQDRATRSRRCGNNSTTNNAEEEGSDFVMDNGDVADDDDFLDDEDDDKVWMKNRRGDARSQKKRKGKGNCTSSHYESDGQNPPIMLISLKAGALGLNLTVANNVYLMDPWWQESIESQAIDRCNRIGQTKPVHVYQLIAENTVESKVIEIQEKKKALIKEAFSGMKSKETQRAKREARLQDIIQLFGINRAMYA